MTRPAQVVINLAALQSNLKTVRRYAPDQKIMAIIKADAYGHGLERVAHHLPEADAFGVACFEEAERLRKSGISQPITLLEGFFDEEELTQLADLDIQTVIHQIPQLEMLERLDVEKPIHVWIKIDTGMHRLGFEPGHVKRVYERLQNAKAVATDIKIVTHFASAQEHDRDSVEAQLVQFAGEIDQLVGERCLANSGAIMEWPQTLGDWVRPGLMLYGVSPFADRTTQELGLTPVMSLESAVISVKSAKKGEKVGYGGTWACPEDMNIGVVAMGYGDGYPRHARSGTPMLINGKTARLIGRPSMDMLTVDLRECENVQIGDKVVLWGKGLPVEEIARCAETIPYELLCGMRMRARFVEINGEENCGSDSQ